MSVVDFEHLKVTTMTVIVKLKGRTTIGNVFPLLDITRLDLPPRIRTTKKFKIPFCGIPGAILSAKFQNITRGIVKSKSKRSFLNSITIDICTSKKNISAKLSGEIIHMCGPNSRELAIETANHIIDHLLVIQGELDYINLDVTRKNEAIQWIKDNTVGDNYVIDSETQEIIELRDEDSTIINDNIVDKIGRVRTKDKEIPFDVWHDRDGVGDNNTVCNGNKPYVVVTPKGEVQPAILNENFFIKTETGEDGRTKYFFHSGDGIHPVKILIKVPIEVMRVKSIIIPKEYPDSYPPTIDPRIVNFYIKYAPDFAYHHVYCQFLDSVKDIEEVTTPDLAINQVNMAMINYSYSLGMSVDKWELANRINGRNGFISRYNNSTDHSVTISLPYKTNDGAKKTGRKNKKKCHTFMVYKSGIVTQSGPQIDSMCKAYYLFMDTIMEIRDKIIQENKPFNLKYRPIQFGTQEMLITCS